MNLISAAFLKREKSVFIFYSVFLACIFLLMHGYQFNESDQAEHLPQVYKLMDPALYKGDYFMDANANTYTVRFFYVWFLYGLSFIIPVSASCFILCIACISLSIYAFTGIASYFSKSLLTQLIAPVLIFFIFLKFTLGSVSLQHPIFICSSIGSAVAAYAILCYFRRKYFLMSALLGIASLFQLMDAVQVFVLMSAFFLFENGIKNTITLIKIMAIYFLCASPMLAPMIYKQFIQEEVYDRELYYKVLYNFRNPHHFLPSHFPLKDYVKTAFIVVCGILALLRIRSSYTRPLLWMFLMTGLGMIVYYLCLEKAGIYGVGKLQWFKSSMWTGAFCIVFISAYLSGLIEKKLKINLNISAIRNFSIIASALTLAVILNSSYIPLEKMKGKYKVGNYKKTDLTLMHEWIGTHLPKDCIILTHPADDSFSCEAKRSAPTGYKAIIHEAFFMLPWYEKFSSIYGLDSASLTAGDALLRAGNNYENIRYKGEEKINYRIDRISTCKFLEELDLPLFKAGDFILTPIRKTHTI